MQIGSMLPICRPYLAAAPLLLLPFAAQAQENFYVDFQLQSGTSANETVVGSLTLAPGTTGLVSASAITGYSFSSATGDPFAFSGSGSTPSFSMGPGLFTVQGNDLLFTPLPWVPSSPCGTCDNNPFQILSFGSYTSTYVEFQGPGLLGIPAEHGAAGPTPSGFGVAFEGTTEGWTLAPGTVIGTLAAPEISSQGAWPAVTLLVGALAIVRGRKRLSLSLT